MKKVIYHLIKSIINFTIYSKCRLRSSSNLNVKILLKQKWSYLLTVKDGNRMQKYKVKEQEFEILFWDVEKSYECLCIH